MKKVFLLFILLLPMNISAIEYTEYKDYKYSDKRVLESDLVEVIKEEKYKFYYKKKIYDKSYYLEGKNNKFFPYKSNIKKYSKYSNYTKVKPEQKKGRQIEEKEVIKYQSLKKIRYIKIDNITQSDLYVHVGNIEIYYDDKLINYNYKSNYEVIENPYDNFGYVKTIEGVLIFDLEDYYDPARVKVLYGAKTQNYSEKYTYDIELNYDETFSKEYIKETRKINFNINDQFNNGFYIKNDIFEVNNLNIKDFIYDNELLDEINQNKIDLYKLTKVKYYRFRDTYYKYYRIEKIYLNGYYESYKGYIKDKKKSKTIYKYRIRDYVKNNKNSVQNDKYRHQEVYIIIPVLILISVLLLKKRRDNVIN